MPFRYIVFIGVYLTMARVKGPPNTSGETKVRFELAPAKRWRNNKANQTAATSRGSNLIGCLGCRTELPPSGNCSDGAGGAMVKGDLGSDIPAVIPVLEHVKPDNMPLHVGVVIPNAHCSLNNDQWCLGARGVGGEYSQLTDSHQS